MGRKERVVVEYVDDLTGNLLDQDEAYTVTFGWGGDELEIDLSKANSEKFEKLMQPYVEAARKVSSRRAASKTTRKPTASGYDKETLAAIRAWAGENGYDVAPRGRIKGDVIEAWEAAR